MKKVMVWFFTGILVVGLCACGADKTGAKNPEKEETTKVETSTVSETAAASEETTKTETSTVSETAAALAESTGTEALETTVVSEENTQIPNPVREVTEEELLELTQISLPAPEGAENVRYSVIEGEGTVAMAQMDFTMDGKAAYLRAESTSELEAENISGLYYEWEETLDVQVGYCEGTLYIAGDVGYVAWLDAAPGILYNLGMTEQADKETLENLANVAFVPLQGDVDGDLAADTATDASEAVPSETAAQIPEQYDTKIREYIDGINSGWGVAEFAEAELCYMCGFDKTLDDMGYLLEDIDGNGTEELLIGEGTIIYDMYTLDEGNLVQILSGAERNAYELCEDNTIYNKGSNGAASSIFAYFTLNGAELLPVTYVIFDAAYNEEEPWFQSSFSPEPQNGTGISEEEAIEIMDSYKVITLNFTKLADYN